MTALSVVLISRNQEWNIARLIESVLRETAPIPTREIILVDSASTDRTTVIAAQYPISVLKLRAEQHLSASAGRYVGYKRSTGDLVLFLDGDMELCEGWLDQALKVIEARPDAAVVCGMVIDRPKDFQPSSTDQLPPPPAEGNGMIEVPHGGGASLYRRSVLEEVGTFNPYLYSDEEPELCLRIRHSGYIVLRLLCPIAFHYSVTWEAFTTFLDKRQGNIWLGYGQNIRYFLGTPLLWPYLRERGWAVAPALALGAGMIAAIASAVTGQWVWLGLWAAFIALLAVGIAIQKRSLKRAILSLFRRLLILDGTLRGLLRTPFDPAGYPAKYEIVR